MAVTYKRRNPAPATAVIQDYPIKGWVIRGSGEKFETITLQMDDGSYLSTIASNPKIRCTAGSFQEAEKQAAEAFLRQRISQPNRSRQGALEDLLEIRMEREAGKFVTHVPELDGLSTYGASKNQAMERTREAITAYIKGHEKIGKRIRLKAETLQEVKAALDID